MRVESDETALLEVRRFHLVGAGGAGMSGLAQLLLQRGYQVSGSDRADSPIVERLREQGAAIVVGHRAEVVVGADLVIYSAAISLDCPELQEARRRGIDTLGRAEFMGRLTAGGQTAAVAGTHGKTTTASMLAAIMEAAGLEPSVLFGGAVEGEIQGRSGRGKGFVVEADEYDRSFLSLRPAAAVVTSLDAEHLDCYSDLDGVVSAFAAFVRLLPEAGPCLLHGDNANVVAVGDRVSRSYATFGRSESSDYRAAAVEPTAWGDRFDLAYRGERLGSIHLQVPGAHNVDNAVAAAGLAHMLGVPAEAIGEGLERFPGVDRRFQRKGEAGGVLVVDDYAHHPTEIDAALAAARRVRDQIVVVFQPHLYSRTRDFLEEFATSLTAADRVVVADVYAAREEALPGVSAEAIAAAMRDRGFRAVEHIAPTSDIAEHLAATCSAGDMVITLGAGDVDRVADGLLDLLCRSGEE